MFIYAYWSGGDLLSHDLSRSTIGATGLNGRVREGIGCFPRAIATRPFKLSDWEGLKGLVGLDLGFRRPCFISPPEVCRMERVTIGGWGEVRQGRGP